MSAEECPIRILSVDVKTALVEARACWMALEFLFAGMLL
jgi:hypothetical protein